MSEKVPLSRVDLVVAAVYLLGGATRSIDTEDVAMQSAKMSPGTFSWRKYPDQIDLNAVSIYLRDAKKERNGALLIGTNRGGWRLSESGMKKIDSILEFVDDDQHVDARVNKSGSIDTLRKSRELERILTSTAYQKWSNGDSPDTEDIVELLRITPYTSKDLIRIKRVRLMDLAKGDEVVTRFLEDVSQIGTEKEKFYE